METKTIKWAIDPAHSRAGFRVKHLMISNVDGVFNTFSGEVHTTGDDFSTAEISFRMDASSIDTGMADRDAHLKSPDFFETEKYPEITFTGGRLRDLGDDTFELTGELTMKGITRQVSLTAEFGGSMKDPWGNTKAGFTVTGKLNRKNWGLNWNAALEAGGVLVSEEVKLNCDIQLALMA
ncbi:MAG: YceI family protein [Bacteroidota bacterium]